MVDYGFFEALTGPMQTAGAIQDNRDKAKLDQLRLQQYQQLLVLKKDAHLYIYMKKVLMMMVLL